MTVSGYTTQSSSYRSYQSNRTLRSGSMRRNQPISYTDRIYARLTMAGHVLVEFTRDKISGYSALLSQMRALTPQSRGLARLTVRNMTRGWSEQRPLMLYGDDSSGVRSLQMPWTL